MQERVVGVYVRVGPPWSSSGHREDLSHDFQSRARPSCHIPRGTERDAVGEHVRSPLALQIRRMKCGWAARAHGVPLGRVRSLDRPARKSLCYDASLVRSVSPNARVTHAAQTVSARRGIAPPPKETSSRRQNVPKLVGDNCHASQQLAPRVVNMLRSCKYDIERSTAGCPRLGSCGLRR
jgi:hypothetical protein